MKNRNLFLSAACGAFLSPLTANAQNVDDHEHDDDEIIVTGSPIAHPEHESIVSATVLTEEDLAAINEATLGQLLRRQPGISSTFFGPGASRPVIRGLSADRIRVLDAGIGSIDASSVSDDHAVAVDPATAQRVEIIRGPAALYYGSSGAGGVINVFDGRIPSEKPEDGVDGALRIGTATVDDSIEAAGGFDVLVGEVGGADLVLHADGFYRDTDDYEIPGFAESAALRAQEALESGDDDEDEEEEFGTVGNSDTETKGGSVGGSLIFENGFIGASAKILRSNYGVPGGGHHHEEEGEEGEEGEEEEELVRIDLEQERYDLMGEFSGDFAIFETVKFRFGYADYVHTELEGAEIGTIFKNEGYEGRIELVEKEFGNFRGASGVQFRRRDFEAIGDEAFTPPNITNQFGVFTVREYETDSFHAQLAGRYEHTEADVRSMGLSRTFDAVSVSGGVGYEPQENTFLSLNLHRTERAPAPEELFSNGPHLATNAFEIGDPTLDVETALGVEAGIHGEYGPITLTLNGFYTSYDDFIALVPNGAEEDDLPVFEFVANDATFTGFESLIEADLFSAGTFDFTARGQLDYVRAEFSDNADGDVPRIPPLRSILGLAATSPHFDVGGEVEIAADQDRIADFELPTEGYTVFNLAATWRPHGMGDGLSVQLRADNITDEEIRLHTSFLKDVAPLPGRNVRLTLRGTF